MAFFKTTYSLQQWRAEAGSLYRLGLPILVGMLAQTGMGAVDTIMAGNYGAIDLAAVAIGQSFWLPVYIFFAGLFSATTTLIAHCYGAGDNAGIRMKLVQSLWLAALAIPLGIFALSQTEYIIQQLGLSVELIRISDDYLLFLSCGLPAAIIFLVLRGLSEGIGQTQLMMKIQLFSFLCNIPLNYLFIFGKLGLPEMGGAGCGVATAITLWLQLLFTLWVFNSHQLLQYMTLAKREWGCCYRELRQLLVLGLPIAFTMLAEVSLFAVVALIIAPFGANILAGHQIALSVSATIYMLPLSIGMAITIQTGQYLGAGKPNLAKYSSVVGIQLSVMMAIMTMIAIVSCRGLLADIYSNNTEVIAMASALLAYAAMYQIPDALQISITSALRAYRDTRIPLVIVLFAYWIVCVPLGWLLCMKGIAWLDIAPMGAAGMWLGLVFGLTIAAVLQGLRFYQKTRLEYG